MGESAAWRALPASCVGSGGMAAPRADTGALTSDLLQGLEALKLEAADAESLLAAAADEWRGRMSRKKTGKDKEKKSSLHRGSKDKVHVCNTRSWCAAV